MNDVSNWTIAGVFLQGLGSVATASVAAIAIGNILVPRYAKLKVITYLQAALIERGNCPYHLYIDFINPTKFDFDVKSAKLYASYKHHLFRAPETRYVDFQKSQPSGPYYSSLIRSGTTMTWQRKVADIKTDLALVGSDNPFRSKLSNKTAGKVYLELIVSSGRIMRFRVDGDTTQFLLTGEHDDRLAS